MTLSTVPQISEWQTLRENVPVREIFADPAYQRPLREDWLARLTAAWDRRRAGVVSLSMRGDGRFACIDGWHRITACRAVEGEGATLPAVIYFDLDVATEAALFTAFNRDRAKPKQGDEFRAALAAGEPAETEINSIVQSVGLQVSLTGAPGARTVQAINAMRRVYDTHGSQMLRDVLQILRSSMGDGEGAIQSSVIAGLSAFLARYSLTADRDRLLNVLAQTSNPRLMSIADSHRATKPGMSRATAIGLAILTLYNTGLRSKQLPPWAERVFSDEARAAAAERGRKNIAFAHAAQRNGSV